MGILIILTASAGSMGKDIVIVWTENFKLSRLCGKRF